MTYGGPVQSAEGLQGPWTVHFGRKVNVCTPLETVYIGCPKQVLVLAGHGDHGDCENIFFMKILLVL